MTGLDLTAQLYDHVRSRRYGKYRGTVTSNDDATKRGRLQVMVPAVLGSLELWAMPCVPYAGKSVGLFAMPPVGAGVWVEFEGGDPSFPIWVGCFWADDEAPAAGDPTVKMLKTDSTTITLDDQNDEVKLETSSNTSITMTDKVETLAKTAKHTVAADSIASELGAGKLEIAGGAVIINNGAWQVG